MLLLFVSLKHRWTRSWVIFTRRNGRNRWFNFEPDSKVEHWSHEAKSLGRRVVCCVVQVIACRPSRRACFVAWTALVCSLKINAGASNLFKSLKRSIEHQWARSRVPLNSFLFAYLKWMHCSCWCSISTTCEDRWIRMNCCCRTSSITLLRVVHECEEIFWWSSLMKKSCWEREAEAGNTAVKSSFEGTRPDDAGWK